MEQAEKDRLLLCLKDAGCSQKKLEELRRELDAGHLDAVLRILKEHRASLLDRMHGCQKKIDCLDFLVCRLMEKMQNQEK